MTAPIHTYGPTCLLADDDPDPSVSQSSSSPPKLRAQFFHTSSLPIDDPLAPLPATTSAQTSGSQRAPPRPFSAKDNNALENAWRELALAQEASAREQAGNTSTRNPRIPVPGRGINVERLRQAGSADKGSSVGSYENSPSVPSSFAEDQLPNSRQGGSIGTRTKGPIQEGTLRDSNRKFMTSYRKRERPSFGYESKTTRRKTSPSPPNEDAGFGEADGGSLRGNPSRDGSISGSPFIRAPLAQPQSSLGRSLDPGTLRDGGNDDWPEPQSRGSSHRAARPPSLKTDTGPEGSEDTSMLGTEDDLRERNSLIKIPVGVSRLHLVELPNLEV